MRRLLLLSVVVLAAACANDPTSPAVATRAASGGPSWGIGTSPSRPLPGVPTLPQDPDPRGIGTSPTVAP